MMILVDASDVYETYFKHFSKAAHWWLRSILNYSLWRELMFHITNTNCALTSNFCPIGHSWMVTLVSKRKAIQGESDAISYRLWPLSLKTNHFPHSQSPLVVTFDIKMYCYVFNGNRVGTLWKPGQLIVICARLSEVWQICFPFASPPQKPRK